jgi:Domain of unknown function(DUF2779)
MPHYLSKSDFKVAQTCPTKLYYKKSGYPSANEENDYLMMLADGGYLIEKIAKLLHPEGQEMKYGGAHEQAAQETQKALAADKVTLFEATLLSNGKLARVDILKKSGNVFDLIEVKAKSYDSDENDAAMDVGRPNLFRTKSGDGIITGWREYLEDVAYQVMVLQELFPKAIIRPFLMMPDKSKTTQIDRLHSLFRLRRIQQPGRKFTSVVVEFTGDADLLRKNHFLTQVSVEAEVKLLLPDVQTATETYLASLQPKLRKISTPISVGCRGCEYRYSVENDTRDGFKECWKNLADVTPHLLDLYHVSSVGGRGGPVVNDLIENGKVGLFDVPEESLVKADGSVGEINKRQLIQLEYTRDNAEWMSKDLPKILNSFKYPLHFIDFETTAVAVPYHAGMYPYEQVAFQWSCHKLESADGPLLHSEWINTDDVFPNFQFAESLMNRLGDDGTIFMWAPHENTILNAVLTQMGERAYKNVALKKWLNSVIRTGTGHSERLVDMNQLTVKHYFHPLMKGRTSIKVVCDALWKTSPQLRAQYPEYVKLESGEVLSPYGTLPPLEIGGTMVAVAEGTGAIRAYEAMVYGLEKEDAATKEKWKRLLLQYCKLDSISMFFVWQHWKRRAAGF